MLVVANAILRNRRAIVGLTVLVTCTVLAITLLHPRAYSASGAFVPQVSSQTEGGLVNIAAQFGMDVAAPDIGQSPAFYAYLLKSRALLQPLVGMAFASSNDGKGMRVSLEDIYEVTGRTPDVRRERAVRKLRDNLTVTVDEKTGVISFATSASSPGLARAVAESLLAAVNHFNVETRETRAHAERLFAEQRMREVQQELRNSEDRLQGFLEANHSVSGDPALTIQQQRLNREVARIEGVYATVSQSYEQAKINEVRDTPSITILERPSLSVLPVPRRTGFRTLIALLATAIIASLAAVVRETMSGRPLDALSASEEFARLRSQMRLPVPWRRAPRAG